MRPASARLMKLSGIAALLASIILLMLFLDRFSFDSRSLFWYEARNFGHVPLFGVIAVILLWILYLAAGQRLSALFRYAIAWLGTVSLGAISEYLQFFSARDADIMDLMFDIAGATAFLALHYTFDSRLSDRERERRNRFRIPFRIAAVAILLVAATPMMKGAAATWYRRTSFPKMFTFSSHLESMFIQSPNADLEYVEPPAEWSGHDSKVAKVTFYPAKYPGLGFRGPYFSWRGYQTLTLDVFSPAESTISLYLMIKDSSIAGYSDRYNRELKIRPGYNEIRIPLAEIEDSPANRQLNLSSIHAVHLFLIEPQKQTLLYLDNLILE